MSKKVEDGQEPEIKTINLIRFAYDVFRHSALQFHVPENSIVAWRGSENDYGYDDFISVTSRFVLKHQILNRFCLYVYFNDKLKRKKLGSVYICAVLSNAIKISTLLRKEDIIRSVETSLSVACELTQFLCSIRKNVSWKEIAEFWFVGYFENVKEEFERAGGLIELYRRGLQEFDAPDSFIDLFIIKNFSDYQESVNNEEIFDDFYDSLERFLKEDPVKYASMEHEVSLPARFVYFYSNKESEAPSTSEQDEDSGYDPLKNTGLGIVPHPVLYGVSGFSAGVAQSPKKLSEEQPRHRRPSAKDKYVITKTKNPNYRPRVEQDVGQPSLESSGTRQSNASATNAATPSCSLLGARPKNRAVPSGESSELQTSKSNLHPIVEQDVGQPSLESSGTRQPNVSVANAATPSCSLLGARPKNRAVPSGESSDLQTSMSSLSPRVEQDVGQVNSRKKQQSGKKSDTTDLTSQNQAGASLQEPAKEPGESFTQEKSEKTKSKRKKSKKKKK